MFWRSKITNLVGRSTEDLALRFLKRQGLVLRTRNYACKCGEIDLIMEDGKTLVFVEVRFRSHTSFGSPEESIDRYKQQKLRRTASHYLQTFKLTDSTPCRFDIITRQPVSAKHSNTATLNWLKNAF